MTKSKTRRGVALGAALLMIILEILAVKGDGFQVAKAGLALLLAILAVLSPGILKYQRN